ncbi:unnamed protein product [Pieris macdunnoughi]|nr:unnamed protein product [Pieris macdunnoughi]
MTHRPHRKIPLQHQKTHHPHQKIRLQHEKTHRSTHSTPEDTPSTPEDTPSTPEDTPSTPDDTPSTPKDTPSTPEVISSTPDTLSTNDDTSTLEPTDPTTSPVLADPYSFWNPFTITMVVLITLIFFLLVSSICFYLGVKRGRNKNIVILPEFDDLPRSMVIPRVERIGNPSILPYLA